MNNNTSVEREFHVATKSGQLFVRTIGTRDADNVLILIHGGPGLSHRYLLDLEQLAGSQLMVAGYDQRGCGRSSILASGVEVAEPDEEHFTSQSYVEDLEAVRQAVAGQKKVHLLGHSWGVYVAMAYAAHYPERVSSLLLIDGVPPTLAGQQAGVQRFMECVQELQGKGIIPTELSEEPLESLKQIMPAYVFSTASLALFSLDSLEFNSLANARTWEVLGNYDLRAQLAWVNMPVQIIFGDADAFGVPWAEETGDAFISAPVTYQIIQQCGHFGWIEQPETFFSSVRAFLAQNS